MKAAVASDQNSVKLKRAFGSIQVPISLSTSIQEKN